MSGEQNLNADTLQFQQYLHEYSENPGIQVGLGFVP